MKDLGSNKHPFCLAKRDVANCRKVRFRERKRPALDSASIPYPALSPYPADRRTPDLCK